MAVEIVVGELRLLYLAGAWALDTAEGPKQLDERTAVGAFPLLEKPYAEVHREIAEALAQSGISEPNPFPRELILTQALTVASSYWKQLALEWIATEKITTLTPAVDRLARDTKWPQELRTRARKVLRDLSR